MINELGKIAPAPWVPFTRAGCDFGAVGTANTILENTAIDIPTVFGAGSPQAAEVVANPGQAFADFVGIGVHCARGSGVCAASNNARPDLLPDEPRGYSGFNGLFGAVYVNPVIQPNGPMTDLDGNVIQDAAGQSVSRVRRHGSYRLSCLGCTDAGSGHSDYLCLRVGCA